MTNLTGPQSIVSMVSSWDDFSVTAELESSPGVNVDLDYLWAVSP